MNRGNYYKFILARLVSSFGNWFFDMALPFIIYNVTGSPLAVAASFMLQTLPVLLLSPFTAYIIDHYSKRNILIVSEFLSAVALILCIITGCNNIYILYSICVFFSVNNNVYNTTVNSYIPEIGKDLKLDTANMIDSYAGNITMIIAPVIAGWCIKSYGDKVAFAIDSLSFFAAVIILLNMRKDKKGIGNEKQKINAGIPLRYMFSQGKSFWGDALLRIILIICIAFSSCGAIFSSLDAVYIAEVFDNSTDVYGYINSAWGIGMLITGMILLSIKNRSDEFLFGLGILFMGIATIGYGLSRDVISCILFNFLGGLSNTLYVVYYRTIVQKRTTDECRGAFFSIQSTLSKIISMIIVAIAGIMAEKISVRYVIVFSGVFAVMISVFVFTRFTERRHKCNFTDSRGTDCKQ